MIDNRKLKMMLCSMFGLFTIYYFFIFIFNINTINNYAGLTTSKVADFSSLSIEGQTAFKSIGSAFTLDSSNNFNGSKELLRVDAFKAIDRIGQQISKSYSKTSTNTPYFTDFSTQDSDAESILRLVNQIDNKENFLKHYNILGYELNRNNPIKKDEFYMLLASFIPSNSFDLSLNSKVSSYISNLSNYGISFDNYNGEDIITREEALISLNLLKINYK